VSLLDGLAGMPELLNFNAAPTHEALLLRESVALSAAQLQERHAQQRGSLWLGVMLALAVAGVIFYLPGVGALLFIMLLLVAYEALSPLPALLAAWGRMQAAQARLAPEPARETSPLFPVGNQLVCNKVSLSYGNKNVLQDVSFTLAPGTRLGIMAPSGAGKTSLIHLLLGLTPPTSGHVTLGSIEVSQLPDAVRAERMAALFQEPQIISGSVADNLQLLTPLATNAQMEEALQEMQLEKRLKLDDWVGENGALLSGGEARRLEIARLLLSPAPIWVLDEPGEWLDDTTKDQILKVLAAKSVGRTLIVISHQPEVLQALSVNITDVLASRPGLG
jgi:ABC-type transport system involved in cytochrome bd biosynthesis fused ATPase/permease subunit